MPPSAGVGAGAEASAAGARLENRARWPRAAAPASIQASIHASIHEGRWIDVEDVLHHGEWIFRIGYGFAPDLAAVGLVVLAVHGLLADRRVDGEVQQGLGNFVG